MRLVLPVLAATLLMGCGDKDEDDTAADTAVEDTAE
tara:strand:- start:1124 stop:1231 length:108 start_codon:yes stop_codon:yes gene_type:complete